MRSLRFLAALALGLGLSFAAPAHAQTEDACIAASEKAVSLRKAGKLLASRKELAACAAAACPEAVKVSCQKRLGDINAAIPTVAFDVKDASGNDLTAVKLTVDGAALATSLDGSAIPLDPGDHEFRFEVAGQPPVVKHFVLREGEKSRPEPVVIAPAQASAAAPIVTPPPPPAPTPAPTAPPQGAEPSSTGSGRKTLALAVGGVGIAGLAIGSIFGLLASSSWSNAKSECSSVATCGPGSQAQGAHDSAVSQGTISTIAFTAGGVLLAGGLVLFITAPSGQASANAARLRIAPNMSQDGAGFSMVGAF